MTTTEPSPADTRIAAMHAVAAVPHTGVIIEISEVDCCLVFASPVENPDDDVLVSPRTSGPKTGHWWLRTRDGKFGVTARNLTIESPAKKVLRWAEAKVDDLDAHNR